MSLKITKTERTSRCVIDTVFIIFGLFVVLTLYCRRLMKSVIWAAGAVSICACSPDEPATELTSSGLDTLLGDSSTFASLLDSETANIVARSFPTPELPAGAVPFQTQPDQRYELLSLSAMRKDNETNAWQWTEQQFFRVAIAPANADAIASSWGFRDIMAQRFSSYDFNTEQSFSSGSAERRAMQLADVTDNDVYINDTRARFDYEDCRSTIALDRFELSMAWTTTQCPQRIRIGNTVIASATVEFDNGVGWISHVYGQNPDTGGAVIIDRFETQLPSKATLRVNRSRRRSGEGPVTVAASLHSNGKTESLRNVVWVNEFSGNTVYPSNISIEVPTLSLTLSVSLPAEFPLELMGADMGLQHGVLVSTGGSVLPGRVTLQPQVQEAL